MKQVILNLWQENGTTIDDAEDLYLCHFTVWQNIV